MSGSVDLSAAAQGLTALLLLIGATLTLIGSIGLLRLASFFQRVHAPTLGTTLGTTCIALASLIHFSRLGGWPVVREALIVLFVTVTTPVSLIVLVRAARLRDTFARSGQDKS